MARRGDDDRGTAPRTRRPAGTPSPPRRATTPRGRAPAPAPAPPPEAQRGATFGLGGLGGLLRGSGSVLGQISGIDGASRSLERLAASAEVAARLLERLDAEVGVERVVAVLDQVDRATANIEEMRRSLAEIELRLVELHTRITPGLDRIRLPRLPRRRRDAPDDNV